MRSICEGWKGRGRGIQLFPLSLMKDVAFRQPLEERLKTRQRKIGLFSWWETPFINELFSESREIWLWISSFHHCIGLNFEGRELKAVWWYFITHDFQACWVSQLQLNLKTSHTVERLPLEISLIRPVTVKYTLYWSTKLLVVLDIKYISHTYGKGFERTLKY